MFDIINPTILIYRHDDPDGLWSGAIVYNMFVEHALNADVIDVPVNYNKNTWDVNAVNNADYVFVLDFTFEDMDKLSEIAGSKLIWIDHHKTAMEKFTDLWNSDINGSRSLDNAGCQLTWWYCVQYVLHNYQFTPMAVKYIADRDMWKFEFEDTKAFCEAAFVKNKSIYDEDITKLLKDESNIYDEYIEFGNTRLEERRLRVEKAFERGLDITFNGYRARIVNTISDISEVGEYIYTKPEYDIAIMWFVDGDSCKLSFRSNSKDPNAPDCSKIAQKYGGGGHFNAAGATIPCDYNYGIGDINV